MGPSPMPGTDDRDGRAACNSDSSEAPSSTSASSQTSPGYAAIPRKSLDPGSPATPDTGNPAARAAQQSGTASSIGSGRMTEEGTGEDAPSTNPGSGNWRASADRGLTSETLPGQIPPASSTAARDGVLRAAAGAEARSSRQQGVSGEGVWRSVYGVAERAVQTWLPRALPLLQVRSPH